ncbi:AI-2E family transporter [Salinicoccus sp. ID82-1]|uniref:AI-2E family transporter n=1 Tax=Salinicoccus sp. ID82-1 TaxID=2820269 RepID=UPI001F2108D0|nr:AI-2E family transporter [Salinicoccus sp. ID82-1]MCG1008799.1 AI-2E family transporter [Salinicoccus sp. ID82-1]
MTHKVWFRSAVAIIFLLLIIRLFIDVQEIFSPIVVIAQTIFLPLLIGGVLFYLTRPVLYFLERKGFPKWTAILLIFVMLGAIIWLAYILIAPIVSSQINSLVNNAPQIIRNAEEYGRSLLSQREHLPNSIQQQANNLAGQFSDRASSVGSWIATFLSGLFSGILTLILVPFFLVYILIDHHKFAPFVTHFFTGERRTWLRKTLHDVDETLKSYIVGQLFVSLCVGIMLLIGYLIIGLDYAILLALVGVATNVIPFLGPYLAVVPAIIVALVQDPVMALYVALIMLIAQQIEGNLITPNIMGNALNVHPLTVITIILAAGNIAGIWGIILAVPFYAVLKTIVTNIYSKRKEITQRAREDLY